MPNPWYSIKAAAEGSDTAEVTIHEEISRWYGVNAVSFLTELGAAAAKATNIRVSINSYGGHVVEALAMFNGLRALAKAGKKIESRVIGMAASAASYIAMAGDKIIMPRNTAMLLHKPANGFTSGRGTAEDHRETASMLDSVDSMLMPAYKARFKGTDAELEAIMDNEELLTAERCLELGLCDEVVDEITATASFDIEKLPPEARKVFLAASKPALTTCRPSVAEIAAIAKAAGVEPYASVLATDTKLATVDAIKARAAEMGEIVALCRISDCSDAAGAFIAESKSFAEVGVAISAARAETDAATRIKTAEAASDVLRARGKSGEGVSTDTLNAYDIWNDIRAMKAGSKQ